MTWEEDRTVAIDMHREFRETTETFKLPSVEDCMIYATTEAGEVISAVMKERNPSHLRRRDDHDPEWECLQTFVMLDSVLMQMSPDFDSQLLQIIQGLTPMKVAQVYLDYAGGGQMPDVAEVEVLEDFMGYIAAWRNTFFSAAGNGKDALIKLGHVLSEFDSRGDGDET